MEPIILDTGVVSSILTGELPGPVAARLAGHRPAITFVTVGELTKWQELRCWGPRRRAALERWLNRVAVLPATPEVARKWGEITAFAALRGCPRPAADTWIAACCLAYETPLATLNRKDFADFADHEGLTVIG
ncbi:type II toxin-antitoxin system VapC family toxin [Allokutzneria sp. A3M-2-11 16]|uniref:type II toxin-antitoxin system VapC family toxin n=1 Tax=Allokutzneria sp. A3M-2-11 16 TaxID=2962043 RepID=UPI0020B8A2F0|nr:type II toxin-antitoxin system VapC family toxin [Allokutzneria sp. A3M-2-11 16]MCP3797676.1 type II toxin-antitoxin system VapC family toxin [Allokutzneria sp. A3M-2-11 16]